MNDMLSQLNKLPSYTTQKNNLVLIHAKMIPVQFHITLCSRYIISTHTPRYDKK